MAFFISARRLSFSSKSWVALCSASATYLLRASSYWSRTFINSWIWRSIKAYLTSCFYLKRSYSLVLFKCSKASFFYACSSILLSSSFSLRAISAYSLTKSSFAFFNWSFVSWAFFLRSSSFNFSLSSSSSTYFLISWPSSSSSLSFLMKAIL